MCRRSQSQKQKLININININKEKTDENQWRTHILAFYMYDKSLSSYIESNEVGRDPFRTRWEKSGLRELKKRNTPYADAEIQYDFWFHKWRGNFIKTKQNNRSKGHKEEFIVHVHVDDDDDDDDDDTTNGKEEETSNSNEDDEDDDDDDDNDDNDDNDDTDKSPPPPPPLPPLLEEEENKKKPPSTKKLQHNEMKDILFEYYLRTDGMKLLTFIKKKNRISNNSAIFRHGKDSGL
jgi:hypothetical protein